VKAWDFEPVSFIGQIHAGNNQRKSIYNRGLQQYREVPVQLRVRAVFPQAEQEGNVLLGGGGYRIAPRVYSQSVLQAQLQRNPERETGTQQGILQESFFIRRDFQPRYHNQNHRVGKARRCVPGLRTEPELSRSIGVREDDQDSRGHPADGHTQQHGSIQPVSGQQRFQEQGRSIYDAQMIRIALRVHRRDIHFIRGRVKAEDFDYEKQVLKENENLRPQHRFRHVKHRDERRLYGHEKFHLAIRIE